MEGAARRAEAGEDTIVGGEDITTRVRTEVDAAGDATVCKCNIDALARLGTLKYDTYAKCLKFSKLM